jgi:hypothetical protein
MPRCGDPAKFSFKVSGELVGRYATVLIVRSDPENFTSLHVQKLDQTDYSGIDWPDLQKKNAADGTFYGGRIIDFQGLDKLSYREKMAKQQFGLELWQGKRKKKSAGAALKIDAYPDHFSPNQVVGIPMNTEMWDEVAPNTINPMTGTVSPNTTYSSGKAWDKSGWTKQSKNCGRFDIEVKDGVVVITVRIQLVSSDPARPNTDHAFDYMKKRMEAFWNSDSTGYNQWNYHRKDCKRGDDCQCKPVKNAQGDYVTTGCCKVPFRLVVEKGGSGDHVVQLVFLSPSQALEAFDNELGLNRWGATGTRAHTGMFYYPENRVNTYAHEVGHMMGFPDQYECGVVAMGAMTPAGPAPAAASGWPIDPDSIMGASQGKAQKRHIEAKWLSDWVNANVDSMKAIDKC